MEFESVAKSEKEGPPTGNRIKTYATVNAGSGTRTAPECNLMFLDRIIVMEGEGRAMC